MVDKAYEYQVCGDCANVGKDAPASEYCPMGKYPNPTMTGCSHWAPVVKK